MRIAFIIMTSLLMFACQKKKFFEGPDFYMDDFSEYATIDDIIDGNNEKWSFFQKTFSENSLTIDTVIYHSAGKSFRSYARQSTDEDGASKASINKQFMAFWEGETVAIESWYYIEGEADANWIFLMDVEEKTEIGAGPGIRIAMVNNQLLVEHKYYNPNITQTEGNEIDFPRNQWVKVRLEIELSQKKDGSIRVWQDDQLIISQDNWKTLPKDFLYFQQGTKGMYSQIEFGVTANTKDNPMTVYVDDVLVELVD